MSDTKLNRAPNYGDTGFWIRPVYREGFKNKTITAVVRPRDRSNPQDFNFIPTDVDVPLRFIAGPGEAKRGVPGNLFPDEGMTVRRTDCIVKHIRELTGDDLRGTAPDTATPELLRYHLATVYNTELPSVDDIVTIWRFEYRPNATV